MPKKILIVDDAMFMRMMLKNLLAGEGYSTVEATNGQEAVDTYSEQKPELVFMDLTMPVMDGSTAIKRIVETDPNAKIIVCSALGQKEMVVDAIQSGARDYIVKPFEKARVVDSVRAQIGSAEAA